MADKVIAGDLCTINWSDDGATWTTTNLPEKAKEVRALAAG